MAVDDDREISWEASTEDGEGSSASWGSTVADTAVLTAPLSTSVVLMAAVVSVAVAIA